MDRKEVLYEYIFRFYNGDHVQFNNCYFESDIGLIRIIENGHTYEYDFDDIREFILVNEYTLSYVITRGYINIV